MVLAACGIFGMVYGAATGPEGHFQGISMGLILLLVSKITKGAIGAGDGWFFTASAWYLNAEEAWILLLGGLAVSWCWGAGLILYRAWKRENGGNMTLPFLACMWPAGIWILLRGEEIRWLSAIILNCK